ncbi:hypothetical protein HYY69_02450 [Candidatus Woesearchaeota archaeon]|nr:hypothetical protein [Candidatus Woesearchaeota archaeon]
MAWHEHLRRDLREHQELRLALIDNLEAVIEEDAKAIEVFTEDNVDLRITQKRVRQDLPDDFSSDQTRYSLAAVYFANARYFGIAPDHRNDRLQLVIHRKTPVNNIATYDYESNDPYPHVIKIPHTDFKKVKDFLESLDAETRHAVHYNMIGRNRKTTGNLATRAELVITETID